MTKHLRYSLLMLFMAVFSMTGWADELKVDFENETSTYSDWTFGEITTKQTNSGVNPHGGSYFGTTGGKASAYLQTKEKIASPQSIQFFVSKQSTNTNASNWIVQVSEDGTTWTKVGNEESASSMTKGTWVEVLRDLSTYEDVYVRIYYSGSTAIRCIDDVTLTYTSASASPLASITLSGNYPTTFKEGDEFSYGGLVVTASYEDQTTKDVTENAIVSEPDMSEAGEQTVTVSYTEGTVTKSQSYVITITAVPAHAATFWQNGTELLPYTTKEGQPIVFPLVQQEIEGKVFVGWTQTPIDGTSDTAPDDLTNEALMGETDMVFYAVYATLDEAGEPSLTKMTANDTFAEGDNVVIVAVDEEKSYGLYQETVSNSYVMNFDFTGVNSVKNDSKTYWTVIAGSNGKWKLGDATNGYLYTSGSNNLAVSTSNASEWTLAYDDDGFTLYSGRYLSCRSDLSGDNAYLWRLAGTSPVGIYHFDIYKYTASSLVLTDYCTTIVADTRIPVNIINVTLNPTQIRKGETSQIEVEFEGDSWSPAFTYTVDNENIATVDEDGLITGVSQGEATITVKLNIDSNDPNFKKGDVREMEAHLVVLNAIHTATFSINGTTSSEDVEEGTEIPFPEVDNVGSFKFAGWTKSEIDGTVTEIPEDAVVNELMGEDDVTYYAIFARSKDSHVTATFDASDISNLTVSTEYQRCWIHNDTGIELYLSAGSRYVNGTPNTFSVTKGTNNYFSIELPAGRLIKVVTTIDKTNNAGYIIGGVSDGAELGDYDEDTETQTVTFTTEMDEVECYATADKQIRASKIDVEAVIYSINGYYTTIPDITEIALTDQPAPAPNATIIQDNAGETVTVTVTRNVKAGQWNTIYLPFAMNAEQIAAAFGADAQVAGLTSYDAENEDLMFSTVTETQANTAYLIQPDHDVTEFMVEDVELVYAADVNLNDPLTAVIDNAQFMGVVDNQTVENPASLYYLANGNKIKQLTAGGTLKAFRGYFLMGGGINDNPFGAKTFTVDGAATGIIAVENGEQLFRSGEMYNTAGQRVGNSYRGVVIVNGKKVIKK